MKTYERADEKTRSLVQEAMENYHQRLIGQQVTVAVLMAADIDPDSGEVWPALKLAGYPCAATMKVTPLADRALGREDALLTLDAAKWHSLNHDEKLALLDHELCHLEFVIDEDGAVRRDDQKRPKLRLRLHDIQIGAFREVAERHRSAALEVQEIRKSFNERGQGFWQFEDDETVGASVQRGRRLESRPDVQ